MDHVLLSGFDADILGKKCLKKNLPCWGFQIAPEKYKEEILLVI